MSKFVNEFRDELDNLELDNNTSNRIKEKIIYKYKKHKRAKRITLSVFIICLLSIVGLGVTYADEIQKTFNTFFVKNNVIEKKNYMQVGSNAEKIINQNANIEPSSKRLIHPIHGFGVTEDDPDYKFYTIDEIERELNISLLKSNLFKKDKYLVYDSIKNEDGKYKYLTFKMYNAYQDFPVVEWIKGNSIKYKEYDEDMPVVYMRISIKTEYYEEEKQGYTLDYKYAKEYYIKNLNTTGVLYNDGSDLTLLFDYDDISYCINLYILHLDNYEEEFETLINSLYI